MLDLLNKVMAHPNMQPDFEDDEVEDDYRIFDLTGNKRMSDPPRN